MEAKQPVFLHSLFRTGSTYIWSKFRERPEFCCYYEPDHQVLIKVTPENLEHALTKDFDSVHHPRLDRCYLDEYRGVLRKDGPGVEFFQKSFSFDLFCLSGRERSPAQRRYIDDLIRAAGDRIPLLKFNRTAMRTSWFKHEYPKSLNLYLVRNPRDQWQSYFKLFQRTGYESFFVMDLLAVSVNKKQACFKPLVEQLPLLEYHDDSYDREEAFYKILLGAYTEEEKYMIFYYLWLNAFFSNLLSADFVLNINLLSKDSSYRQNVHHYLQEQGLGEVDFEDAKLEEYSSYPLQPETLGSIEQKVQEMIIRTLSQKQIGQIFRNISAADRLYYHYEEDRFQEIRTNPIGVHYDLKQRSAAKMDQIVRLLSETIFIQTENIRTLENLLQQKNVSLGDNERLIKARDSALSEREQIIQTLQTQLRAKADELGRKDAIINHEDELILGREEEFGRLHSLLRAKDDQLRRQEFVSGQKDREILQNQGEINKLELSLQSKVEELKQKDNIISQKHEEIQAKDSALSVREQSIQTLQTQLQARDEQLGRQKFAAGQKDREILQNQEEINKLELSLQSKVEELKTKDLQLSCQADQISRMSSQLKTIKGSPTFKTGKIFLSPVRAAKKTIKRLRRSRGQADLHKPTARPVLARLSKYERKIDLADQLMVDFGRHRSGLKFGLQYLKELQNPEGTLFDAFVERTFLWRPPGVEPPRRPWIGIIHVPPRVPEWFLAEQSNERLFQSEAWEKSSSHCQGLFALSGYHRSYLRKRLPIPIDVLFLPTETPDKTWSWDKFSANKEKKIVQVGWWLRRLHAIYQLPPTSYKKIFLSVEHEVVPGLMEKEREILKRQELFREEMYNTAEYLSYLPDEDYDDLLSRNIVFLNLYDTSANNAIIECLVRNTPLLINPLEAVKEYLGEDYPFYFNSLEEAVSKVMDHDLVFKTHRFLVNHPVKRKLSGQYFLESFATSSIYRRLKPDASARA
jgi:hypothetical protein